MEEAEVLNPEDYGYGMEADDVIEMLQPQTPAAQTQRTTTNQGSPFDNGSMFEFLRLC